MFKIFGRATYRLRWFWIVLGIAGLGFGVSYGAKVFQALKDGGLIAPSAESARENVQLLEKFPNSRVSLILLARSSRKTVEDSSFQTDFTGLLSKIKASSLSPTITSYYTTHQSEFISKDRHAAFALIGYSGDQAAGYHFINNLVEHSSGLVYTLGGPSAAGVETDDEVQKDLPKLGSISLPLLLILLLLIFRSPIAAMLPLILGAISVLGAFSIIRLLSTFTDISVFAANIVSLLGLGLTIDYSLLYISRFRDELSSGKSIEASIVVCSSTAGEAIFLSGSTVATSLLGLLAFPEMFLRSMGLGGAIAVVVAMAASLTVLPAALSLIGRRIDLLSLPTTLAVPASKSERFWRRFATFVVTRPVPVLVLTLAALLTAGVPFMNVRFANPGISTLPKFFPSYQVYSEMKSDFPKTENPTIEILLTTRSNPEDPTELAKVGDYVKRLSSLKGVRSVNSYVSFVGSLPSAAMANYVDDKTCLITIGYDGGTYDPSTQRLVSLIRSTAVPPFSKALVGGDTAELVDRLASLRRHVPTSLAFIYVVTFFILLAMLSSVVVPLKAMVLNTLSLSASFGVMTWIFQEGHLHHLLHFAPAGSLDPTLPVLIFAIAFGLATDYEVFLVSRIREEYRRLDNNSEAVVIGVEKTGAIITSAGLLLVVVVAAFGLSDILSMKEMGIGLAVSIAVDAAIVRTFLVPAAMQLFDRLNWWLPWHSLKGS